MILLLYIGFCCLDLADVAGGKEIWKIGKDEDGIEVYNEGDEGCFRN